MTEIKLEDLINGDLVVEAGENKWLGTGVFDVLMHGVNKNVETQYLNGRITGADYATVYSNSIVAVLQQSIDYILREKLVAAQVDDILVGIDLKKAQIDNVEADTLLKGEQLNLIIAQIADTKAATALKEQQEKLTYVERVKVDKETAMLGLDSVIKGVNVSPEPAYTPKYEE